MNPYEDIDGDEVVIPGVESELDDEVEKDAY